ncbi:MAG: hypothetical protein GYA34_05880 [Chloroflexi bacterium]|nr:hypothetical protein [Chloroflexota bacterium]
MRDILANAAQRGIQYRENLENRSVIPTPQALSRLAELDEPLPEQPTDPQEVLQILDEIGSPATVATAGGRNFGFVIGSSMPVTLAVNWLAGAMKVPANAAAQPGMEKRLCASASCLIPLPMKILTTAWMQYYE